MSHADHIRAALPCPVKVTGQTAPEKRRDLFGLKAKWLHFANERQLRRLAKLHVRIERRKVLIAEDHAERLRIQDACIKQMRRNRGLVN